MKQITPIGCLFYKNKVRAILDVPLYRFNSTEREGALSIFFCYLNILKCI